MTFTALLIFAGVYALAVFSPGPGVAAVVARAMATGTRRTLPFILGIVIGDLVWFGFVVGGLAAVAQNFHIVFRLIQYAGAAYLLWLAWKLWTAPATSPEQQNYVKGEGWRLLVSGCSLTLGNPKTMVFFVAILPQVVSVETMSAFTIAELCVLMTIILAAIMLFYSVLADRARRFISSPKQMQMVNRATGGVLAGVAAAIAAR